PAHSRSSSSLSLRCSTLTPGSTLFPYTTLFRSRRRVVTHVDAARLLDDVRDRAFVAVGDDAEVLGVGNVLDEDERAARPGADRVDRKSTRLNSSHVSISYAVFCLKKKTASSNPP